jgi:hypothetical protein
MKVCHSSAKDHPMASDDLPQKKPKVIFPGLQGHANQSPFLPLGLLLVIFPLIPFALHAWASLLFLRQTMDSSIAGPLHLVLPLPESAPCCLGQSKQQTTHR